MSLPLPLALLDRTPTAARERDDVQPAIDEAQFRAFYERTARPLWAYLARVTADRELADDLLQESYYRFVRAGARHESESHRRRSLFQIATNLARDAARRPARRSPAVSLDDEAAGAAGEPRAADPGAEGRAVARTDLARAMRRLEPTQRAMLWLAYAQGSSHEEIAEILGLRPISVRTLLLRARRKLALLLDGGEGRR